METNFNTTIDNDQAADNTANSVGYQRATATAPAGFAAAAPEAAPAVAPIAAPAAAQPATAEAMIGAFAALKARRENWEQNQLLASNEVLYGVLQDCYTMYGRTQTNDALREKFIKAYEAKYGHCKAGTSVATKIIWAVFGKEREQRAHDYSRVIRIVYQNLKGKSGTTFREYVIAAGGIEEIRRNGGNTNAVTAQREAKRQTAIAALKTNPGFANSLQIQLPADQQEKNADHNFRAALIREDADNTFTIVMISTSEVPVNSMLAEFAKREEDKPTPAATGTVEAINELAQLISDNVNA